LKTISADEKLLRIENEELRSRLSEAIETLNAIRHGEVDAIVVTGTGGDQIFSLTSAETPYRIILENMNEGAVTLSEDGTILFCNQRCAELLALKPEQILGAKFSSFVVEIDRPKFQLLLKTSPRKKCNGIISCLVHKHEPLHFLLSFNPIPSDTFGDICMMISDISELKHMEIALRQSHDTLEQRVAERTKELTEANNELSESRLAVLNMMEDIIEGKNSIEDSNTRLSKEIAERKQAMVALKESEQRFRGYFELPLTGRCITSPEKGWIEVNQTLCEMLGYTKTELMQLSWTELTYPEDLPTDLEQFNRVVSGEIDHYTLDQRFIHKNGQLVYTHIAVHCARYPDNTVNYFIAIVIDITERKQAEDRLRNSEEKYRLITENSNDVIWKMNADTFQFTYISPSVEHLTGFSVEEAMQHSIFQSLSPESANSMINELTQTIANYYSGKESDKSIIFELQQSCKNGQYIWVEVSVTFLTDEAAKIVEIIGVSRNIEQRKQAEQIIFLKNEELNKVNAEKDKFFSIIAHDLRSPFNGFLGLFRVMEKELPSMRLDEIQKLTQAMSKSAKNLYRLIENLLDWSRLKRGMFEFNPIRLMLMPNVSDVLTSTGQSAVIKGIEISYDIPADLEIVADENMLSSTLRNLTSNAVKFTPKGGKILIAAKELPGNQVEISIKDSGIGMNPTRLTNLFHLDGQTNRKGTEGEPSAGLGLIICKEFIEKMGGKLWVESEEGKGSIFYFTLPGK